MDNVAAQGRLVDGFQHTGDHVGLFGFHHQFAFAAHRAVVDVDPELGLVKVVQVATVQPPVVQFSMSSENVN